MKYVVTCTLCACFLSSANADNKNLDKFSIIFEALQSRKTLPLHYHVALTEADTTGAESASNQVREISVWAKKHLLRTDAFKRSSSFDSGGIGWREITCRNCERPGYALKTRAGGGSSLGLVQFLKLDADFDKIDSWRIDWRGLGLLHDSLDGYATKPYTRSLDLLAARAANVAEVKPLNGSQCYVLTSVPKGDVRLTQTCWFRPDLGMSPVLFESSAADWDFKKRTAIEYSKLANLDTWYPSSVHHYETHEGKVVLDEKLTVQVADFVTPVPDSVFTVPGLGLDNNQPIAFPGISQTKDYPTWHNGKVDREYTAGKMTQDAYAAKLKQAGPTPPVPDTPPPSNRNLYLAGAAVLALLAGGVFVLARRSRNS